MTTDTTHLSGYLLDYYAALAENMTNPRLRKHEREDTYICVINDILYSPSICLIETYSPTTNPALALPIIDSMMQHFDVSIFSGAKETEFAIEAKNGWRLLLTRRVVRFGDNITEAALRALVAWKFPDGLPEPIYESEK